MPNSRNPGRPKKEAWQCCKVVGCAQEARGGRGLCPTHYMAARRGRIDWGTGAELRPMKRVATYGDGSVCLLLGCGKRPRSNGLCSQHYQAWRSGKDVGIDVPELNRDQSTRKYSASSICVVAGCLERPVNRWMCSKHSQQREAGILDESGNQLREPQKSGRKRSRSQWVGSTRDRYVLVIAPAGHPRARVDGTILEHRFVMEQRLGRYLEEWEIVHHKDGDRSNNSIENLELLDGRAYVAEGHPPGHSFDPAAATQVLLQRNDMPDELRVQLAKYRERCL